MISSTVEDLRDERQAADDAVRHFQFERFRSETLGSLSRAPEEVCDEMARECDLYILIIGKRYGWVIPDLGLSVTEREYNVARATDRGKILVYVRKVGAKGREPREIQFMDRVTDFKAGYFRSEEFSSPDELKRKIQHDIAIWISDRLRQKQLSPVDALSLPQPREVAISSVYVLVIILGVLFIPSALRYFGNSWQPSSTAIMRSFVNEPEVVLVPIGLLWMQVFLNAWVVALLSVPILNLCVLTQRSRAIGILGALSHLCFGLATMFFFGRMDGIWPSVRYRDPFGFGLYVPRLVAGHDQDGTCRHVERATGKH